METPEGCFYDQNQNAHDLLTNYCHIDLPQMPDIETYIESGPSFVFQYNPALGPLYSIIAQKISKGKFSRGSELKLEIAEVDISGLNLTGSLHIIAERVIGETNEDGFLRYSENVGCCRLTQVSIENQGTDPQTGNFYWSGKVKHLEICEIVLHGNAEFHAENICLRGNQRIEVESGIRLTAFEENGLLQFRREFLSGRKKTWNYNQSENGCIQLT